MEIQLNKVQDTIRKHLELVLSIPIAKLLAFLASARFDIKTNTGWPSRGRRKSCLSFFSSGPTYKFVQSLLVFQLEEWEKGGRLYCRKGDKAWAPRFHCLLLSYWLQIWEGGGKFLFGYLLLWFSWARASYLKYWVRCTATHCKRRDLNPHFSDESVRTKLLLGKVLKFTTCNGELPEILGSIWRCCSKNLDLWFTILSIFSR